MIAFAGPSFFYHCFNGIQAIEFFKPLIKCLVRIRFANENEIEPKGEYQITQRMITI